MEFVYFIKAGCFVKVGKTKNIDSRLKALQTSNPVELKLIGYIKTHNPSLLENDIHKFLIKKHERGEWFRINEEDSKKVIEKFSAINEKMNREIEKMENLGDIWFSNKKSDRYKLYELCN